MLGYVRNLMGGRSGTLQKSLLMPEPPATSLRPPTQRADRVQTFSKVLRYRLPDGQTTEPKTVEVIGSFTNWHRVVMQRDSVLDAWHVTIHHIRGNRTHHYMLLIDGKPAYDKNCDGLAVPHGPQEEQYCFMTDKGPRVFMLAADTR